MTSRAGSTAGAFLLVIPMILFLLRISRGAKVRHHSHAVGLSPKRALAPPFVRHTLGTVSGRVIVVGDVHGCLDELDALLAQIEFRPNDDQLVLVGDLVGKGPKPLEVIARIMELKASMVLGNHDWTVLRWADAIAADGPDARPPFSKSPSEHQELARTMPAAMLAHLRAAPHLLDIPQHNALVVHAGLDPEVDLGKQNAFDVMHMRTITHGTPTEKHKGTPWASLWPGPQTVVFGHDAHRRKQLHPFAVGLDTGCVYGGQLTCFVFPDHTTHSVDAARNYAPIDD